MPTIPPRIASALVVLFGQYGDVTKMARDREHSRQSLYREAEHVIDPVDGTAAQARINDLEPQVAQLQAPVQDLHARLVRSVEMTPEKQAELACVAQAEGGQPASRPAPPAGRDGAEVPERADAGARHPRGRTARRPVARRARRGGPSPGRTGGRR